MSDFTIDPEQVIEQEPIDILNEEQRSMLKNYLNKEIGDTVANAGREERIERNKTIERQRTIRPKNKTQAFPWDGAANTVPPLMWTKISSVVGRFVQSILDKDPIFSYDTTDPDWNDHAIAVTKHIASIVDDANQAGFRQKIWMLEFDKASYGTVFVKVPFEIKDRVFTRGTEKVNQLIRHCPKPIVIPFEDFITRYHWSDIQEMPWYAVRTRLFMHELKALEAKGVYENVDLVLGNNHQLDDEKLDRLKNMGIDEQDNNADPNKVFEIFEVNIFFDVEGDGIVEDIIVHYEKDSNTILRVEFNDLGRRDIVRIPYAEIMGSLYGMGLGDMTSSLQEMIETVFNTSFNSDELSYMGLLVTRQGSGIEFGEDIYPGATVSVPNPAEDLNLFKFPSVTEQAMLLERKIQDYADEATGATKMMVGQEGAGEGNRIGSQGTQMLAQKGEGYLQTFLNLALNGYKEIGQLFLLQMVRNSDYVDYSNVNEADRLLLEEVYNTPVEEIASKFKFNVSLTAIKQDKGQRQQALVQLFELFNAYMDKQVQYVTAMSDPQLAQPGFERLQETLMTAFVGMNKLFEKIAENFDITETGDLQPYFKDLELILEMADKQKGEAVEQQRTQNVKETAGATEGGSVLSGGAGDTQSMGGSAEANPQAISEVPVQSPSSGPDVSGGAPTGI